MQRFLLFFFKQKTAYEILRSDWSSDVCSSDLRRQIFFKSVEQMPRARAASSMGRSKYRRSSTKLTLFNDRLDPPDARVEADGRGDLVPGGLVGEGWLFNGWMGRTSPTDCRGVTRPPSPPPQPGRRPCKLWSNCSSFS